MVVPKLPRMSAVIMLIGCICAKVIARHLIRLLWRCSGLDEPARTPDLVAADLNELSIITLDLWEKLDHSH